jgi:hypothetical protein
MVRLFKHYIPHAVPLLGLIDFALLLRTLGVGVVLWPEEAR